DSVGTARNRRGDRRDGAVSRRRVRRLYHRAHTRHRWRMDRAMIKRFHVVYVGQIELENIGLAGAPANQRRDGNGAPAGVFWTARNVAQLTNDLSYHARGRPSITFNTRTTSASRI